MRRLSRASSTWARRESAAEAIEAVKLGVLAGGSVAYPATRDAVELIDQLLT